MSTPDLPYLGADLAIGAKGDRAFQYVDRPGNDLYIYASTKRRSAAAVLAFVMASLATGANGSAAA